jgi:HD-like signal output (HDOD) protein
MNLDVLFQQPNALPTAPKVVQELINSFNDEHVSADEIARKLAADPVLSAKLLRLANSAYYRVSRSVSTVDEAVVMLGFVTVRTLVISGGLVNGFKSTPGLDLKQFWRYSLHTAVVAKWLSRQVDENSDLAFTVGMTHAIGQLVIHAGLPEQALKLDNVVSPLDVRRFETERNSLGYDYAEVGAELASRWKFPEDFSSAIRAFPNPLEQQPFIPMAAIIHLAAWFARSNENNLPADEMRAGCPTEVAAKLGLDPSVLLDHMPPLSELSEGLEELIA